MNTPVDIRAAIRHAVSALHGAADDGADTRRYADALHEASVAVAELIAAANDFRTTQSAVWIEDRWADLTSRYCLDTEFPTNGEVVIAVRNRFDAALARAGGGA